MPKIAAGATDKNISLAPNGTGKVVVGTGAADATVQSDGNHNLILQTGNSTTGKIEIVDGANGNIDLTPNGTGEVDIAKVDIDGGTVDGISLGTNSAVTEAQIDNINIDGNEITSTDTNGNIDLTPNGTGEVNISKVDIDSGAIDGTTIATSDVTVGSGKTLDVSAGTLTTSTTQKQAVVDGADITTVGTVTSGTISTGAVIDDPTMTQGSDATGDVYYRAASGKLTRLATGADGTVLTSTGIGAVPAFEAASAGGKLLQVVNVSTTSTYAITSSHETWQAVGPSQGITPQSTSSKFLVTCSYMASTGGAASFLMGFKASGSSITTQAFGIDDTNPVIRRFTEGGQDLGNQRSVVFNYLTGNLSQSNTTDAITFATWARTVGVTDCYIGTRDGNTTTEGILMLTIMEVAA